MRHVSIFCYDLEAFDCLCVTNDVVEEDWSVFFHPTRRVSSSRAWARIELTMAVRSWQLCLDWL